MLFLDKTVRVTCEH